MDKFGAYNYFLKKIIDIDRKNYYKRFNLLFLISTVNNFDLLDIFDNFYTGNFGVVERDCWIYELHSDEHIINDNDIKLRIDKAFDALKNINPEIFHIDVDRLTVIMKKNQSVKYNKEIGNILGELCIKIPLNDIKQFETYYE